MYHNKCQQDLINAIAFFRIIVCFKCRSTQCEFLEIFCCIFVIMASGGLSTKYRVSGVYRKNAFKNNSTLVGCSLKIDPFPGVRSHMSAQYVTRHHKNLQIKNQEHRKRKGRSETQKNKKFGCASCPSNSFSKTS